MFLWLVDVCLCMTGLYRYECSGCGEVVITDDHNLIDCPECGDIIVKEPSAEHDQKIMEAPPEEFECPDCGEAIFALATERGDDWMCRMSGGCRFSGWMREVSGIRAPKDIPSEEHARRGAWSRYQRYKAGHYEY